MVNFRTAITANVMSCQPMSSDKIILTAMPHTFRCGSVSQFVMAGAKSW